MDEECKRVFRYYMTDDNGDEYELMQKINDNDPEFEDELEYLLDTFKCFLRGVGYSDTNISRIQYLAADEWKYVLTQYGNWDGNCEQKYEYLKGVGK